MSRRATYVTALEHCALLLAAADKEARKALAAAVYSPESRLRHQDSAVEFTAQADRISLNVFGWTASDLERVPCNFPLRS